MLCDRVYLNLTRTGDLEATTPGVFSIIPWEAVRSIAPHLVWLRKKRSGLGWLHADQALGAGQNEPVELIGSP